MSTPTNTGGIVGRGRRTFGDPAGEFNQTVTVEGNYEATGSNDLGWSALVVKTAGDAVLHTHMVVWQLQTYPLELSIQ